MKNFARSWYIRVRARERQPRLGYQGHAAALYKGFVAGIFSSQGSLISQVRLIQSTVLVAFIHQIF